MKDTFSVFRKAALCAGAIGAFTGANLMASSSTLEDYYSFAARLLAKELRISLSQSVTFTDNKDKRPGGDAHSSWEFESGAKLSLQNAVGNLVYGVNADLGWTMYHKSHRDPELKLSLTPFIDYSQEKGNLMITSGIDYRDESLSTSDTQYAKYYEAAIKLAYDWSTHDRYGMVFTVDGLYDYYTDNKYNYNDKFVYGASIAPYYNLSNKTKTGIRAGYEKTDYRNQRKHDDMDEYYTNLFVNYQITLKLNATAEAGYSYISYGNGSSRDSKYDDKFTPNYRLAVNYSMLSNLMLFAKLNHTAKDSAERNARGVTLENSTRLGSVWRINPKFNFTNYVEYIIVDEKDSIWDSKKLVLGARADYSLLERVKLYGSYTFTDVHFDNSKEDYKVNEVTLGVNVQF